MFRYLNKNLRSLITGQRLLSLLLVLNIIVSCLVICFSYGLYQNYNMIVEEGEHEDYTVLEVFINEKDHVAFDEKSDKKFVVNITPAMLMDMMMVLSDNTKNSLSDVSGQFITTSPLSVGATENSGSDKNKYYSEDDEPYYVNVYFSSAVSGDKFVDALDYYEYFTDEQYSSGEKIVAVAEGLYNADITYSNILANWNLSWTLKVLPEKTDSIIIGGEEYEITKLVPNDYLQLSYLLIPLTAMPEDAKLTSYNAGNDGVRSCLFFNFNEPITSEQYKDLQNCIGYLGEDVFLEEIEFTEAKEIYYYKTIMLISVVIAALAAINMAILYRYILEKRSSELAIFRICGCSKGKAIASYLLECMIINIPLFALTQLCYHKLIMPKLTGLFPNMAGAYSFKLYAAIFGIYIGASMLIMLIMIISTIRKHSLVDLKRSAKATTKFSIMKVFEVAQLAIVLSIMFLIMSAIVSRYELYNPFKQYFERRGYMVYSTDATTWTDDFEELIGDAEYIMTQSGFFAFGDYDSGDYTDFGGIIYDDEFVQAYAPPMEEGVWLGDTDETYEKDGYIPTVVTYCDGRYHVGDILESDAIGYDENDQPIVLYHYKYKIIGVLKNKVNIPSYEMYSSGNRMANKDYRAIYAIFSDDFEENDFLLRKISDEYACSHSSSIIRGVQFVFCDDMSDEEYDDLGIRLNGKSGFTAVPLSEARKNSLDYIYEQMYTLFPIAACIFILTIISTVSISAIYTKRQLRNYAIFYICGARWRTCALKSLRSGAITCAVASVLSALILIIGKATLLKETVISFGLWHLAICAGVIVLYLILSMIMPLSIIGSAQPREVLKEE